MGDRTGDPGGRPARRTATGESPEQAEQEQRAQQAAENGAGLRRVLFTGHRSRLVVTTLRPGEHTGGDALCVPAGTRHGLRNTGTGPLRIATVHVPARHASGAVHRTKPAVTAAPVLVA